MNSLKWYGPDDTLIVGKFEIKGPMVYAATSGDWDEPSAINTTLPVRKPSVRKARRNDFWGEFEESYGDDEWSYEELSPTTRWRYLEWLRDGRASTTNLQFLLLYLQGLERRVIVDRKNVEQIWDELWRISSTLFGWRSLVKLAIDTFLWNLLMAVGKHASQTQVETLVRRTWQLPVRPDDREAKLSLLVAWGVIHFGRLPAWLAFYCASLNSGISGNNVLKWAEPQALQLFTAHIKMWNKTELQLKLPAKMEMACSYVPFNDTVPAMVMNWPNVIGQRRQWKKLSQDLDGLFSRCVNDLRPYVKVLEKDGVSRESRVAWEFLPVSIRPATHPCREKLWQLGGEQLKQTGRIATTAGEIARILEMAKTPALSSTHSKVFAQSLQLCELGVEPDARLSGRAYRWDDEVLLFTVPPRALGSVTEAAALRYQQYAAFARYALHVAQAAGEVGEETLMLVASRLNEVFELQPLEKQRMQMLVEQLARREISLKNYRVPPSVQDRLREHLPPLLLEMARSNGQVNSAQEEVLAVVWKRLGLSKKALTCELDALSSSGVLFVGNAVTGRPGEKLPPPPLGASPTLAFELDHGAIGDLLEDTAHVHRALSEAMAVEEVGSQNAEGKSEGLVELAAPILPENHGVEQEAPANGLPPQLNALLTELLQQGQWPKEAAGELARRHDTMLAGAVEKINDWAFEEWGEQLIYDDGDVLSVEQGLMGNG